MCEYKYSSDILLIL